MVLFPPHRKVLCQVPACWWREGLKCAPADELLAARLHISLRRPGVTRSWSLTNNHHNCISLGRAMGLWVIAVGVRPTSPSASPRCPKAVSHLLCVDQHRTTVCTSHISAFPEKRSLGFSVPRHAKLRKHRLQLTGPYSSHLCRTRVSTCGWLTRSDQTRRTGTDSCPSHEPPVSSDTCASQVSRAPYRQEQGK